MGKHLKEVTYQSTTKKGYRVVTNMQESDMANMYNHDKGLYDYIFFG